MKTAKKVDPMKRLQVRLRKAKFIVREVYGVQGFLVLANRAAVARREDVGQRFADELSIAEVEANVTFDFEADPVLLNERAPRVGITGDDRFYFLAHVLKAVTYAVEVQTAGDGEAWNGNALRFATKLQAEEYAKDLFSRWTAVRAYRVVESSDPVNR